MKHITAYHRFLFVFLLFSGLVCFSQSKKQEQLESRRQQLIQEIQKINKLRKENISKEKSELSLIQDLNHKIRVLQDLIEATNNQANFLNREINTNQNKISDLRTELNQLTEDYAAMIVKSYKSKNKQSRIMFLLSSEDFKQAYKRLQYMKQYSEYQKEQGEIIKQKTLELQQINTDLIKQKEEKDKLLAENKDSKIALLEERQKHDALMKSIKNNLNLYANQIKQKQREADKIEREIDNIIKAAIAASNKKAGKASTSKTFALTAEEQKLANDFTSNKGKLPWPLEKGYVSLRFGTQPHPINQNLTIQSNGVRLTTEKGAKVRAIFNGEVIGVAQIKNANLYVIIRHGDYFTAYKNLSKVYVKKGDKVKTKQEIGEVFSNPTNGETILSFNLSKNGVNQNPASWIYKM